MGWFCFGVLFSLFLVGMGEVGLLFLFFGEGSGWDWLVVNFFWSIRFCGFLGLVIVEVKLKVEGIFFWKLLNGLLLIVLVGDGCCWFFNWLFGECGGLEGEGIELGGVGG